MVSTGHYLATMAAVRILEQGGNAFDAGVAAGLCINVVQPDMTNIGGVAPVIAFNAATSAVSTISGLGNWPQAARREYFVNECNHSIPPGVRRSVIPAAIDSWITSLQRWGTMTFREVSAPAIELAADGFAIYPFLLASIEEAFDELADWPSSAAIFLDDAQVPEIGSRLVQRDLARTLERIGDAERAAPGSREHGLQAARDCFYRGGDRGPNRWIHDGLGWLDDGRRSREFSGRD